MSPQAATVEPIVKLRRHQNEVFRRLNRVFALIWMRQDGKTTTMSAQAWDWMLEHVGSTTVFMASNIALGQELLYREVLHWQALIRHLKGLHGSKVKTSADDDEGELIDADAIADQMSKSGMELRFHHSDAEYSRTVVIAPSPNAVGRSGNVIYDEVGRSPGSLFLDIHASVKPFITANRDFRYRMSTTPPLDTSHPCVGLLAPSPEKKFTPKAEGDWYRSEGGMLVHRHDVYDAAEAGIFLFDDDTGKEMTPAESREAEWDKDAWDRDRALSWATKSGLNAIVEADIIHAQSRAEAKDCVAIAITEGLPKSPEAIAALLRSRLPDGFFEKLAGLSLGLGLDLASSDGEHSNPLSLTIAEDRGGVLVERLVLTWKSREEAISREIVLFFLARMAGLGIRPKGMAIDASNNFLWADMLRKLVVQYCPCELVINSNVVEIAGRKLNMKQLLGKNYAGLFEAGKVALAPASWLKQDHLLVFHYKDTYDAKVLPDGRHADTFDSGKLAQRALGGAGGPAEWNRPDQRSVELGTGMGFGEYLMQA